MKIEEGCSALDHNIKVQSFNWTILTDLGAEKFSQINLGKTILEDIFLRKKNNNNKVSRKNGRQFFSLFKKLQESINFKLTWFVWKINLNVKRIWVSWAQVDDWELYLHRITMIDGHYSHKSHKANEGSGKQDTKFGAPTVFIFTK